MTLKRIIKYVLLLAALYLFIVQYIDFAHAVNPEDFLEGSGDAEAKGKSIFQKIVNWIAVGGVLYGMVNMAWGGLLFSPMLKGRGTPKDYIVGGLITCGISAGIWIFLSVLVSIFS